MRYRVIGEEIERAIPKEDNVSVKRTLVTVDGMTQVNVTVSPSLAELAETETEGFTQAVRVYRFSKTSKHKRRRLMEAPPRKEQSKVGTDVFRFSCSLILPFGP